LAALLASARAEAHHPMQEHGPGHVVPRTFFGADVEATQFDFEGLKGSYLTFAPRGEYSILERLGIAVRLPLHRLTVDGEDSHQGLGDIDLALKVRALDTGFLALSAGLGGELPTATQEELGSGHPELSPFVSAMFGSHDLMAHGACGLNWSLESGEHEHAEEEHHELTFIDPHTDRELVWHVGGMVRVLPALVLNAVLAGNTVLVDEERGDTFVVAAPEATLAFAESYQLSARVQVPVAGEHRYEWRGGISLIYTLDAEDEAHEHMHHEGTAEGAEHAD
jgi:hypothetical protein